MNKSETDIRKALLAGVTTALEGMVFEEVEPADTKNIFDDFNSKLFLVYSPIIDPLMGIFLLAVPENTAKTVTINVYGKADMNPDKSLITDTLKEIINTASGCFMRNYLGYSANFSLGLSVAKWGKIPELERSLAKIYIDLNGKYLMVEVAGKLDVDLPGTKENTPVANL